MGVSAATYERVAMEDDDETWELVCGRLRRKPGMTQEHMTAARVLGFQVQAQLDIHDYQVAVDNARVARGESYFVPDVAVLPVAAARELRGSGRLEVYAAPLPFVAEVWSPSTGEYDVDAKFPEYRRRGDLEIWRVHPSDRTVTAWVRQADGSYAERTYAGGSVTLAALPVTVDLGELWG